MASIIDTAGVNEFKRAAKLLQEHLDNIEITPEMAREQIAQRLLNAGARSK